MANLLILMSTVDDQVSKFRLPYYQVIWNLLQNLESRILMIKTSQNNFVAMLVIYWWHTLVMTMTLDILVTHEDEDISENFVACYAGDILVGD